MVFKNFFRNAILNLKIWFFGTFPNAAGHFYRYFWSPRNQIEKVISRQSLASGSFRFLQIGANDGIVNDPIMKFIFRDGWNGIRVEPLSVPFEKLKRLHSSTPEVRLIQGLVGVKDGIMPIYHLSFSTKRWATGLASLNRESLVRQIESGHVASRARKFGDMLPQQQEDWITSIDLKVVGVNQMIQTEFNGSLDLLQIDTEGFDHTLVNALNLEMLDITLICFEKLHIPPEKLNPCLNRLRDFGYEILFSDMDILAFKPTK